MNSFILTTAQSGSTGPEWPSGPLAVTASTSGGGRGSGLRPGRPGNAAESAWAGLGPRGARKGTGSSSTSLAVVSKTDIYRIRGSPRSTEFLKVPPHLKGFWKAPFPLAGNSSV